MSEHVIAELNAAVTAGLADLRRAEKEFGKPYRLRFYTSANGTIALDVEPNPSAPSATESEPITKPEPVVPAATPPSEVPSA